jgi:hypothetical protein
MPWDRIPSSAVISERQIEVMRKFATPTVDPPNAKPQTKYTRGCAEAIPRIRLIKCLKNEVIAQSLGSSL